MRIAVCDDCREDALDLKSFLSGQEVRIYTDPDILLDDVLERRVRFDLYLLDIFMETSMNGIRLAEKIRSVDRETAICFISASDAYYREAYDLYAIQYLIKPVREESVRQLLNRMSQLQVRRGKDQSVRFKWRGQTRMIAYGEVLFISSREHTVSIQCADGSVQECKGKLNEMEAQVSKDVFMRCHQSFLVNMYQVDNLSGNELMVSGYHVPISRRYYTAVKRRYQEILFEEVD